MTVACQITCHSSIKASTVMIHATVALLFRLDVFRCVQQSLCSDCQGLFLNSNTSCWLYEADAVV